MTVYYQVTADNYTTFTGSATVTVSKASVGTPTVTMAGYTYGGAVSQPTIGLYDGGGDVTYYYNTTNSTTGGTEWEDIGSTTLAANTYYMYAEIAETANYNAYTTGTTSFTVSPAAMSVDAPDVEVTYDGQPHGIAVSVNEPDSGVTVKFRSTEYGDYDLDESPTITNVSDSPMTVYYQVTADNYTTVTGSATVTISKASVGKSSVTMSDYLYGRTVSTPSVSSNPGNGTVTYYYNTTDSTTGGTEWKDIGSTTLAANTYYMYAKIAETANYNAYTTGTTSFTVASATEVTTAVELKEALDRKDSYVLVTAEIAAEDDFTVDAATTLILEDKLSVYSMPMTVNGRVEIHEGGELYIGAEETLENNGIITNDGTLGVAPLGALYNAGTINNNSTLNIEYDDGYGETGVFINGSSDSTKAGTVKNAGTITIDGKFINPGGGTVTNLSGGTITGEIRQQGSVTSGVTNANDSYYLAAFDANGGYWEDGDVLWLVVYAKKDASGYAEVSAPTSAPEAGASVEGKICVRWSYKDENGDDRTLNSGGSTAQIKQDTVFQAYWDFAI